MRKRADRFALPFSSPIILCHLNSEHVISRRLIYLSLSFAPLPPVSRTQLCFGDGRELDVLLSRVPSRTSTLALTLLFTLPLLSSQYVVKDSEKSWASSMDKWAEKEKSEPSDQKPPTFRPKPFNGKPTAVRPKSRPPTSRDGSDGFDF